jgi:hypothetical protein
VAVHDAPVEGGSLSFALRWHGARPALLWDAPVGTRVRASALDPSWEADGGAGESLLAELDATRLLPLGSAGAGRPGVVLDEPESFS